jgi:hypothetical protein
MTRKFVQTAVLCAGCLWSAPILANSLNINFNADTPGSAPAVNPTPGDPMIVPSALGGNTPTTEDSPPLASEGTILAGSAPGMAQGAIMTTNSSNGELGALWIDNNGFNLVGQQVRMSFDINVLAAPTAVTVQPKNLGSGTAGILLGMNTFLTSPGGGSGFRFAAAPTSASGGVFAFRTPDNLSLVDFFNYTEGQTYNVAINADYTAGTLNAYVDGVQKLSNYTFLPGGASGVNTGEYFFYLNGQAGFANTVGIDNIQSSVVPEPASIVLLGMVGSVLGLFGRRRTRS